MKYRAFAFALAFPFAASAQTVDCSLKPSSGYTGVTPTQMQLDFDSSLGKVIIRDNVAPKVGKRVISGDVRRYVGQDILFSWQISGVPQSLKPPTETKFYRSTVNYSGRFSTSTGTLRIVGNFVTSVSSANTGLNMRAEGGCQ